MLPVNRSKNLQQFSTSRFKKMFYLKAHAIQLRIYHTCCIEKERKPEKNAPKARFQDSLSGLIDLIKFDKQKINITTSLVKMKVDIKNIYTILIKK